MIASGDTEASKIDRIYLPVIAIVLITLLNDACVLTIARDRCVPSKKPQQWNMSELFIVSSVLGFVACLGSVLMMYFWLHVGPEYLKDHADSFACLMVTYSKHSCTATPALTYGQFLTVLYLKLSLTDFITVFSARTRGFFFTRLPGGALVIAFFVATGATTFIATHANFPGMEPITIRTAGIVWVYDLIWFFLQDICKVTAYGIIDCCSSGSKASQPAAALANPIAAEPGPNAGPNAPESKHGTAQH